MKIECSISTLGTEEAKDCVDYLIDNGYTFQVECRTDGVSLGLSIKARQELLDSVLE